MKAIWNWGSLVFLLFMFATAMRAGGIAVVSPSYEVAAYLSEAEFASWHAVRWERVEASEPVPKIRKEYLLLTEEGRLFFVELTEKEQGTSDGVLGVGLFGVDLKYSIRISKSHAGALCKGIRSLTLPAKWKSALASRHDLIVLSSPGSPGIAYSRDELVLFLPVFERIKEAMRTGKTVADIEEMLSKTH